MKKKKVLVYGSLKSLQEFFTSTFNSTYKVAAVILTDAPTNTVSIREGGGYRN